LSNESRLCRVLQKSSGAEFNDLFEPVFERKYEDIIDNYEAIGEELRTYIQTTYNLDIDTPNTLPLSKSPAFFEQLEADGNIFQPESNLKLNSCQKGIGITHRPKWLRHP
jgi:hypothetical protein